MADETVENEQFQPKRRRRHAMGGDLRGPDLKEIVGQNSYQLRHKLDLTQETMARKLGVTASFLGGVERGQQNMTLDSLSNLALAYGVDAHALVCGAEHGHAKEDGLTLDVLARYLEGVTTRVQELLIHLGPVKVNRGVIASLVAALFDVAGADTQPQVGKKNNRPRAKRRRDEFSLEP